MYQIRLRTVLVIAAFAFHLIIYIFLLNYKSYCRTKYANKFKKHRSFKTVPGKYVAINVDQNYKILSHLVACNYNTQGCTHTVNITQSSVYKRLLAYKWKYSFDGVDGDDVLCPAIPINLGPVADDKYILNIRGLDDMYHLIQPGGIYIPAECTALQTVGVVVPLAGIDRRNKKEIANFLYYIHSFLMRQQAEYQIFLIQKKTSRPHNRGELFNIGFKEALAYRPDGWNCVIFHDIHLVPLDTRNLYRCSHRPRKLIADFKKPYRFGGAIAMRPKHFIKVNGFSNTKWAYDNDYIDMYYRLLTANFTVEANVPLVGNYTTIEFLTSPNDWSHNYQQNVSDIKDGLSNVLYEIKSLELKPLYTLIEVDI